MFKYPVTLIIENKERDIDKVSGIAKDTKRNTSGEECIELITDSSGSTLLIVLTSIISMTVDVENPYFKLVSFTR